MTRVHFRGWLLPVVIVAVIGLTLGVGLGLTSDEGGIGPGNVAPDFVATNVRTGDTVSLTDMRGDVVLLNVWATWCKECEDEMPSLQHLSDRLRSDRFRVVAVSIDQGSAKAVRDWVDRRALTFTVLHDPTGRIKRLYQTTGVPETFILDRHGIIVKRQIGARDWDAPAAVADIQRLNSPPSAAPQASP